MDNILILSNIVSFSTSTNFIDFLLLRAKKTQVLNFLQKICMIDNGTFHYFFWPNRFFIIDIFIFYFFYYESNPNFGILYKHIYSKYSNAQQNSIFITFIFSNLVLLFTGEVNSIYFYMILFFFALNSIKFIVKCNTIYKSNIILFPFISIF